MEVQQSLGDLEVLPDEILLHIFFFLSGEDLVSTRTVSKRWRAFTLESMLWVELIAECLAQKEPHMQRQDSAGKGLEWSYRAKRKIDLAKQPPDRTVIGCAAHVDGDTMWVFEGEWLNGKPHGYSTCYFFNKSCYEGMWECGKREGEGECTYTNGDRFVGRWSQDKRNGFGVYYYFDGVRYEGHWLDNQKHGSGVWYFVNCSTFEGFFKLDRFDGFGSCTYEDGTRFVGEWVDDRRHGHGMIYYTAGDIYEGGYTRDQQAGKGRYIWEDHRYFSGVLRSDMFSVGTYTWPDGSQYTGQWGHNEQRHGVGRMVWRNKEDEGHVYQGEWDHDRRVNDADGPTRQWDMFFVTDKSHHQRRAQVRRWRKTHEAVTAPLIQRPSLLRQEVIDRSFRYNPLEQSLQQ